MLSVSDDDRQGLRERCGERTVICKGGFKTSEAPVWNHVRLSQREQQIDLGVGRLGEVLESCFRATLVCPVMGVSTHWQTSAL